MSFICFLFGHQLEERQKVQEIDDIGFMRIDFLKCSRCEFSKIGNIHINPIFQLGKETNMISYAKEYFDIMTKGDQ